MPYDWNQYIVKWLSTKGCQMTWNTNESLKWKFRFTGFIFYIFLNKSCKNIRVRTKIYWSCAGGPLLIAVDFFFFYIFLNKSWKIYESEQRFNGLVPEDRCSSWGLKWSELSTGCQMTEAHQMTRGKHIGKWYDINSNQRPGKQHVQF